ncbi:MAG: hypothetical protein K8R40_02305 [Anaerolineaceae bacterium]|nr:hypothetical protein [Anaerolineaceae bacterium]
MRRDIEAVIAQEESRQIMNRAGEVAERVKAEGSSASMEYWDDLLSKREDAHLLDMKEKGAIAADDSLDRAGKSAAYRAQNKRSYARYKAWNREILAGQMGMLKAWGTDNQYSMQYINEMNIVQQSWGDSFNGYDVKADGSRATVQEVVATKIKTQHVDGKNDLNTRFFATKFDNDKAWNLGYEQLQDKIQDVMNKAWDIELSSRETMDSLFSQMWEEFNGTGAEALAWQKGITDVRIEMNKAMKKFIAYKRNVKDAEARSEYSEKFYKETYLPLIQKLQRVGTEGSRRHRRASDQRPNVRSESGQMGDVKVTNDMDDMQHAAAVLNEREIMRAARQAESEAAAAYYGSLDRNMVLKGMKQSYTLNVQEMEAVRVVMDLRAEEWARENGRDANEWWGESFADIVEAESGLGLDNESRLNQDIKGATEFIADGRALMRGYKGADVSTAVHELAHVFRRQLNAEDTQTVAAWVGMDSERLGELQELFDQNEMGRLNELKQAGTLTAEEQSIHASLLEYVQAEEQFARGFEKWLAEEGAGKVEGIPTRIANVFRNFAEWIRKIYGQVTGSPIDVDISPAMNELYTRVLGLDRGEKAGSYADQMTAQTAVNHYNLTAKTESGKLWHQAAQQVLAEMVKGLEETTTQRVYLPHPLNVNGEMVNTRVMTEALGLTNTGRAYTYEWNDLSTVVQLAMMREYAAQQGMTNVRSGIIGQWVKEGPAETIRRMNELSIDQAKPDQIGDSAEAALQTVKVVETNIEDQLTADQFENHPLRQWMKEKMTEENTPAWLRDEVQRIAEQAKNYGESPQNFLVRDQVSGEFTRISSKSTRYPILQGVQDHYTGQGEVTYPRIYKAMDDIVAGTENQNMTVGAVKGFIEDVMRGGYDRSDVRGGAAIDLSLGNMRYMTEIGGPFLNEAVDYYWDVLEPGYGEYINFDELIPDNPVALGRFLDTLEDRGQPEDILRPEMSELTELSESRSAQDAEVITTEAGFKIEELAEPFEHGDYLIDKVWYMPKNEDMAKTQAMMGEEGELVAMVYVPKFTKEGTAWETREVLYHEHAGMKGITSAAVVGVSPENADTLVVQHWDGTLSMIPRMNKEMMMFQTKSETIAELLQEGEGQQEGIPMEGAGVVPGMEAPPLGEAQAEAMRQYVSPMLDVMERNSVNQFNERRQKIGELDADTQAMLNDYLDGVKQSMPGTKLAAMRGGETKRDAALLNYNRRYGIDQALEVMFPYQLWYTRSMMEWARRTVDKPQWYAMYARLRRKQQEYEEKGIPGRLRNKMRFLAPYLPDWAGNMGYYDPLKQLFPMEGIFGGPFEQARMDRSRQRQTTYEILRAQRENGEVSEVEYSDAMETQDGYAWNRAWAMAGEQTQSLFDTPQGMAEMMMGSALYIDAPKKMLEGRANEISVLPVTRTGQAIEHMFKDTKLEPLGIAGSILAWPERKLREMNDLSEFGEYGDYYIDRQLANMAAENPLLATKVQEAMITREGELYNEAYERVAQEVSLRVPGSLQGEAIKNIQEPKDALNVVGALFAGLFPMTLVGEGELRLRGLSEEYGQAWDRYNAGDTGAINQFFEDYPEYEARMAMFDEPEERLNQFLISNIWDAWADMESSPNKYLIAEQIPGFQEGFLDKTTRDYTAFDAQQLANISATLKRAAGQEQMGNEMSATSQRGVLTENSTSSIVPGSGTLTGTPLDLSELYGDSQNEAVSQYWQDKDTAWPGISEIEQMYFANGKPEQMEEYLQPYWDWKKQYQNEHPDVKDYYDQQKVARIYEEYPQGMAQDIEGYLYDLERRWGEFDIGSLQDGYYDAKETGNHKAYLAAHPELAAYWDWKSQWREYSPGVNLYLDEWKLEQETEDEGRQFLKPEELAAIPMNVKLPLLVCYQTGEELGQGTQTMLKKLWEEMGQPGGTYERFEELLRQSYGY